MALTPIIGSNGNLHMELPPLKEERGDDAASVGQVSPRKTTDIASLAPLQGSNIHASRLPSLSTLRLSTPSGQNKKRGGVRKKPAVPLELLRRSRRLAAKQGPAKTFDRFFRRLPGELQLIIWDIAVADESNARCVVVRNSSAAGFASDAITNNPMPPLWRACVDSRAAMLRCYRLMFGRLDPAASSGRSPPTTHRDPDAQLFDPSRDVALFQPCGIGCRGAHCAKRQFSLYDRVHVRAIAVQMEPHWVAAVSSPIWLTIITSFPNLETLYVIRKKVFGSAPYEPGWDEDLASTADVPRSLARVRFLEDAEQLLWHRFLTWKRRVASLDDDQRKALKNIEFVTVVERKFGGAAVV
ncbi:hypothetical protein NKR23_g11801 [Pleurostoma richardsiae]|uniref:2EXR domain-containing protein n=1 Tax=Pleurostoma richardsiae TaxID=41990 RepID=A0AA38R9A8_9PEZI|nr:hypothetical protein NKR23_g11801 [Pleurostoma richardsiae]